MNTLKRIAIIALVLVWALSILSPALAFGDVAAQADGLASVAAPPSSVDTFFSSNLGQAILTAIGGVASAGFLTFTGSEFYKTRTNFVTRRIAELFAAGVAHIYVAMVRDWKAKSPTGSLTPQQKLQAENAAMSLVKKAAEDAGLGNHPLIKDPALLRGAVVNAVTEAKAAGVMAKRVGPRTSSSTKGA